MTHRQEEPVDIGWQRMAALLDREMPVQGQARWRRLIVGWYWRVAVAAAVVAAGLFALLRLGSPADAKAVVHQEAIHATPHHPGEWTLPEEPCPETSAVLLTAREEVVPIKTKPTPAALVSARYPVALTVHPSAPWLGEMTETPTAVQEETLPAAVSASAVASSASAATAGVVPSLLSLVPPAPLASSTTNASVRSGAPMLHLSSPAAAAVRKPSCWRLGIEATVGLHAANNALTYGAGPIVEYRTASPVSLRGGLQMATVNYQLSAKNANRIQSDDEPVVTGGGQYGSDLMEVVARSVQRGYTWSFTSYSLQLPMVISYALRPRVMLEAGLSPALISTISQLEGEVAFDALVSQTLPRNAEFYRSAVDNSTERLALLLSAGARYRVAPNWSLGFYYQLSLNDLQPLSTIQARQQNMRLSGVYYF